MSSSTTEADIALAKKQATYYQQSRSEMLAFIPETATRVLEVGCASGYFGEALKSRSQVEVWGIEHSPDAASKAVARLDRVLVGNIETGDFDLPESYFDCVVLNDVLEHLVNPWSALQNIRVVLRPGGKVIASIPNMRHWETLKDLVLHKRWTYVSDGVLDSTHLRFFTINSIQLLFESTGYRLLKLEGINGSLFPWKYALANRLLRGALEDTRYLQFACVAEPT